MNFFFVDKHAVREVARKFFAVVETRDCNLVANREGRFSRVLAVNREFVIRVEREFAEAVRAKLRDTRRSNFDCSCRVFAAELTNLRGGFAIAEHCNFVVARDCNAFNVVDLNAAEAADYRTVEVENAANNPFVANSECYAVFVVNREFAAENIKCSARRENQARVADCRNCVAFAADFDVCCRIFVNAVGEFAACNRNACARDFHAVCRCAREGNSVVRNEFGAVIKRSNVDNFAFRVEGDFRAACSRIVRRVGLVAERECHRRAVKRNRVAVVNRNRIAAFFFGDGVAFGGVRERDFRSADFFAVVGNGNAVAFDGNRVARRREVEARNFAFAVKRERSRSFGAGCRVSIFLFADCDCLVYAGGQKNLFRRAGICDNERIVRRLCQVDNVAVFCANFVNIFVAVNYDIRAVDIDDFAFEAFKREGIAFADSCRNN